MIGMVVPSFQPHESMSHSIQKTHFLFLIIILIRNIFSFSFLLALLAIGMKSWILRRSCMLYAKFSYIRENRALTGFVGETIYNSSHADCEIACVESSFCKSLNIEDEGERRCELNTKSPSDKSDGVSLIAMPGWTFKSTNYQDYLVRIYCAIILIRPCACTI